MDCNPPGSSVHGIFQARVLEWGAIATRNVLLHSLSSYICLPLANSILYPFAIIKHNYECIPWTARRSNQSILKEINPEYSLEGMMLKLQYFGHLMRRVDSLEKTLMLGGIGGRRRRGQQRMRQLDSITNRMDMSSSKLEIVKNRGAWCAAVHGAAKSRTQFSN